MLQTPTLRLDRASSLNDLVRDESAKAVIHTGEFGFIPFFFLFPDFDHRAEAPSIERIHDPTPRHLVVYSPLIPSQATGAGIYCCRSMRRYPPPRKAAYRHIRYRESPPH